MSTIHSTFNRVNTSYTVIGSNKKKNSDNSISALVLNRGGRPYRNELYKELTNMDIKEVVSIEVGTKSHFDLEKESLENECLRFLILKDEVSIGEMINIGISECRNNFIFVIWDDIIFDSKSISYRVFEKIVQEKKLCTIPLFFNEENSIVPTLMTPLFDKELLKVVPLGEHKNLRSLYPFMYVGIYNKEKFIRSGGYDIDFKNSYWQKLDFGLRVNLWGEDIRAVKSFKLKINQSSYPSEDITPDEDYRLYSLKNLSVKIKNDIGYLPFRRFYSYYEKAGSSFFEALKTFKSVRTWVKMNKYRFKYSAPTLTKDWEDL